jgi:hypothetical protein
MAEETLQHRSQFLYRTENRQPAQMGLFTIHNSLSTDRPTVNKGKYLLLSYTINPTSHRQAVINSISLSNVTFVKESTKNSALSALKVQPQLTRVLS